MKHALIFLAGAGSMPFVASPVLRGDICGGNPLCYLLIAIIGFAYSPFFPYFLGLTAIIFIVLTFYRRTISFGKESKSSVLLSFIFSAFLSFILIFSLHNSLSTRIEKQRIVNSYKQELNQLNYELYVPTYIPDGHNLFEARVDSGNLSFYYSGNKAGLFIISEFIKPPTIDLSPPGCYIEGGNFEVVDGEGGFTSAVGGNCQEIKTPKGTSVYLMTFRHGSEKRLAAIILGNTLITISGYNFSNQELIDLIDGLEGKSASDINFKVRDWQ